MRIDRPRWLFAVARLFFLACLPAIAVSGERTENLVLVTLDGVRTQEVFGGLDLEVLRSILKKDAKLEEHPAYKKYWAATAEERREKLLPFLWGTLLKEHGSIAGNRWKGSVARITNRHRFSYPGYSEILTGEAHDDAIKTNDLKPNPFPTVLEFLRGKLGVERQRVAVFGSWEVIGAIAAHEPGSIFTNSGYQPYDHPDPILRELGRLQREAPTPWDDARHDAYTFRFALAHFESFHPRVLYLGFDETDDWAHEGNYERVLDALHRADGFLRQIWERLESLEGYRGRTSLLVTTDHGRGDALKDWKEHGEKIEGAQYIWIAAFGPESAARGEWTNAEPVTQSQIAATIARLLGYDYLAGHPGAGKPIERFLAR